jgi:hypothetical protein
MYLKYNYPFPLIGFLNSTLLITNYQFNTPNSYEV